MAKDIYSSGKMTLNFIINFILYSILGYIIASILGEILQKTTGSALLVAIFIPIVMVSIAIIFSVISTFRKGTISKENIKTFITNIIIFFTIIAALGAIINFYQYHVLVYSIINFAFGLLIPVAFIPFVRRMALKV